MSRTLDKYGINIRNSALNEKLLNLGINTTVDKLSQADKALLRTIVILDSSKYAWADLSDTIEVPANQIRMLTANLKQLSRMIGSLFLPIIKKVLPYVNALVIALQRLVATIAKALGINLTDMLSGGSGGSMSDAMSDVLDDAEGLEDSLADAEEDSKKLKNNLLGIDELNVLSDSSDDTKLDDVGNISGLLDDAFMDAVSEYQKAWDEAFNKLKNKAQELADKIEAWAKRVWKPIGEAWDAVGDYVIERWKHFKDAIGKLFKDIARDWATVWAQENTEKIFESIFKSVGNILELVANLADRFREAWNEGQKGLHILEALRDIVLKIAQHVEKMTLSWANWAKTLNFNPILQGTLNLLQAIRDNADSILGIVDDFQELFLQPIFKYIVEEFLPKVQNILANIINKIDWAKLRENLATCTKALERIAEVLGNGLLSLLERFGDWVVKIVNGNFFKSLADDFTKLAKALESAKSLSDVINALFDFGDGRLKSITEIFNDFLHVLQDLDIEDALKTLGKRIAGAINTIFETLDRDAFSDAVADIVNGIFDMIIAILEDVNWVKIGMVIGDCLRKIDWLKVVRIVWDVIKGIIEAKFGSALRAPLETGIISAIGNIIWATHAFKLVNALCRAITGQPIIALLANGFGTLFTKGASAGASSASASFGSIVAGLFKNLAGVGSILAGLTTATMSFVDMWKNGFNGMSEAVMLVSIALAGVGAVLLGAPPLVAGIVAGIVALIATIVIAIHDHWDEITAWWNSSAKPALDKFTGKIKEGFDKAIGHVKDFVEKWKEKIKGWAEDDSTFVSKVVDGYEKVKETFTSLVTKVKEKIAEWRSNADKAREEEAYLNNTFQMKMKEDNNTFLTEYVETWRAKLQEVKDILIEKWNLIIEDFTAFIENWRTKVTEWAEQKWEDITNKIDEVREWIAERWELLKEDFTNFIGEWHSRIDEWAGEKWTAILNKMDEVKSFIKERWENMISDFKDFIGNWVEKITEWATQRWNEITDKIESVKQEIYEKWQLIKQDFADFIKDWGEKITEWASKKWDEILETMRTLREDIKQKWEEFKQDFAEFLQDWKAKLAEWATEKWDEVKEAISKLKEHFKETWDDLKEDAQSFWDEFKTKLGEWATKASNAIHEAFQKLPSKLADVFDKISEKAKSTFGEVQDWVGSIWNDVSEKASAVKEAITGKKESIASSSKVSLGSTSSTAKKTTSSTSSSSSAKKTTTTSTSSTSSAKKTTSGTSTTGNLSSYNNILSNISNSAKKATQSTNGFWSNLGDSVNDLLSNILGKKISVFANGGFPRGEDGLFFANHSELVGKFSNGKTAVANNDQITRGIADATYSAFMRANSESSSREEALLEELISAVKQGSKISIDGREIVTAYDNRKARNGYAF